MHAAVLLLALMAGLIGLLYLAHVVIAAVHTLWDLVEAARLETLRAWRRISGGEVRRGAHFLRGEEEAERRWNQFRDDIKSGAWRNWTRQGAASRGGSSGNSRN